ncbi:hypothetical protein RCL1_001762 [Eukaryota sp. TZLM3-RCL]
MHHLTLSQLPVSNSASNFTTNSNFFQDSQGSYYCLIKVANSIASDRFSFLTTLKHPFLLNYHYLSGQQNGEIAEEYCPLGSLNDLIQAHHKFSPNDYWCILTQLVYLFSFFAKMGLILRDLKPEAVFICSLDPICIKVSLISRGDHVGDVFPGSSLEVLDEQNDLEFTSNRRKSIDNEMTNFMKLFVGLLRPLSLSFSSCFLSTNDEDLTELPLYYESCCIGFRNHPKVRDCVAKHFPFLLVPKPIKITSRLEFSNTLLFHVFNQSILKFKKPLLEFDCLNDKLCVHNRAFSKFASSVTNVSSLFRDVFFRVFDLCCINGGHILYEGPNFAFSFTDKDSDLVYDDFILTSQLLHCHGRNSSSKISPGCSKWFTKFPPTCVCTKSLEKLRYTLPSFASITRVELLEVTDVSLLSLFPTVTSLRLCHHSQSFLAELFCLPQFKNIRSMEIESYLELNLGISSSLQHITSLSLFISDLTHLSSLSQLISLSLKGSMLFDLLPLQRLPNLSYLDLRKTLLSREHRRIVRGRSEVKKVVDSFRNVVFHLNLSYVRCDLYVYAKHNKLTSLILSNSFVSNFECITMFKRLEILDLSYSEKVFDRRNSVISDISFVSNFPKLRSLSLDGSEFTDLIPLTHLSELESLSLKSTTVFDLLPLQHLPNLVFLDLRETSLSREHQRIVQGRGEIKNVIDSFDPLLHLDFSRYICEITVQLDRYNNYSNLKSLNVAGAKVFNIDLISSFIDLEYLNLSNVTNFNHCEDEEILNISFLSSCTKLKTLLLELGSFSDFSVLSMLKTLENLSLKQSNISDLTPLSSLKRLESLSLKSTRVFDLWPLECLPNLATLDVRETYLPKVHRILASGIDDVTALVNLFDPQFCFTCRSFRNVVSLSMLPHFSNLKLLSISNCQIELSSFLTDFINLECVDLSGIRIENGNTLADISFLSACSKLKYLFADYCQVSDLSPLSFLSELEHLSLIRNYVFDLSPLKNLTKLSYLDVSYTLLPTEHQRLLMGATEIHALVNSLQGEVIHLEIVPTDSWTKSVVDMSQFSTGARVLSLNVSECVIANPFFISLFSDLEMLNLSAVKISGSDGNVELVDVSFVSSCGKLRCLDISRSHVSDLSPVSDLKHLTILNLESTKIFDLSPLCNLTNLSELDVTNTLLAKPYQILVSGLAEVRTIITYFEQGVDVDLTSVPSLYRVDISWFAHCSRLKSLISRSHCFSNILLISRLVNLITLDLTRARVLDGHYAPELLDISFLSSCSRLTSLTLDETGVEYLGPLSCLYELSYLSLRNTNVSNLKDLLTLTKLSTLDVRQTKLVRKCQRLASNLTEVKELVLRQRFCQKFAKHGTVMGSSD